jgi:hypothetical protein
MIAALGCGLRPIQVRSCSRSAVWMRSQVPSKRQRRNHQYTVGHGGNSFGKSRHWQPVRITYEDRIQNLAWRVAPRPAPGLRWWQMGRQARELGIRQVGYVWSALHPRTLPRIERRPFSHSF